MTLTMALTITGIVLVLGVLAHGVWQARKAGERRVGNDGAAGSLPPRLEPGLDGHVPLDEASRLPDSEAMPLDEMLARHPLGGETRPPPRARPMAKLDALVDALVTLRLDAPVAGEALMPHQPAAWRAGSKPILVEGLNADSGEWETLQAGQRYSECQAGVLLANRHGALNQIEYSEFVQKIERFAEGVGASAEIGRAHV
jgi:hypothetical protein